jgi:hypothetical protein
MTTQTVETESVEGREKLEAMGEVPDSHIPLGRHSLQETQVGKEAYCSRNQQ